MCNNRVSGCGWMLVGGPTHYMVYLKLDYTNINCTGNELHIISWRLDNLKCPMVQQFFLLKIIVSCVHTFLMLKMVNKLVWGFYFFGLILIWWLLKVLHIVYSQHKTLWKQTQKYAPFEDFSPIWNLFFLISLTSQNQILGVW